MNIIIKVMMMTMLMATIMMTAMMMVTSMMMMMMMTNNIFCLVCATMHHPSNGPRFHLQETNQVLHILFLKHDKGWESSAGVAYSF